MTRLLERECELFRLAARLDEAHGGAGGLVMIEGGPGLGKTSLIRATALAGRERGFEVLRARGAELEQNWPFGIVGQLLEPVLRSRRVDARDRLLDGAARLAAPVLLPELTDATPPVDPTFGTLHGLFWLCANLAAEQPILMLIDDAQWADEASTQFIGVLARRLDPLPVLVVLGSRPALPPALAQLASEVGSEVLRPRALSPAGTRKLLAGHSPDGQVEPEFALACQRATGGNPFLLTRLAAGLSEQGVAFTAAATERLGDAGVEAVRDAVGAALARLDPSAVALAEAVAVLEDDAELTLAAQLAGIDRGEAAADELTRAGVLADARPLRFVHAIVRDAVTTRLSAGVRDTLHARAAELLAARHTRVDAVAVHLMATQPRGRDWVVRQLVVAARQSVARGAPGAAASRLRRALAEPPAPDQTGEVVLELARAESALGTPGAAELFHRAHELAPGKALRARAALEGAWAAGPAVNELAIERLEHAIEEDDAGDDLALQLEAAHLSAIQVTGLRAQAAADARRRWAGLGGRTLGERLLLAQLAIGQVQVGGPARLCAEFAERAVGNAGFDDVAGGELSMMLAIIALYKADHLDVADRVLARELQNAQRRGGVSGYAHACNFRAAVAIRRGELAVAEAEARAGLDALPAGNWQRSQMTSALLDTLVETGRLEEAQALLTREQWDGELPNNRSTNVLQASRARLRRAQGDHRRALDDSSAARQGMARGSTSVDTNWAGWARTVLLHHALGDPQSARREAAAFLERARRWDTPAALGQALSTNGLLEGGDQGLALMAEGVAHLECSPARLVLAEALIQYGAALRRAGDRVLARDPLRRGLDLASSSGARPLAETARQELTATGIRVHRDAQTGIDSLTPSQRRVADLAASGATNPQIAQALFVTVKTVEMHLSHAYTKLGITSRKQLATQLSFSSSTDPRLKS